MGTALAGAVFLHRRLTVQSKGTATRPVDWAQSSALMVRREAAAEVGYLDPAFFVYYDECDFAKRLADAGWHTLFVPAAEAVHHDQLSTDLAAGLPRIVEFHRNRDLYMRKHHSRPAALAVRAPHRLGLRPASPRRHRPAPAGRPRICWAHARQALFPRGDARDSRNVRVGKSSGTRQERCSVLVHQLGLVGLGDGGAADRRLSATSPPGRR